jgi:hypothetical protein
MSAAAVLEQDFQQHLRVEVTRSLGGRVRLWRQPSGRVVAKRGGVVECAPVGAADLSGVIAPTGVRLEVECKGAKTPTTDDQVRWRESMGERGAVALQLRYDAAVNMEGNLVIACATIAHAIAAAECVHPDDVLFAHPAGGVWCTGCGWRSGGRAREIAL